MTNKFYVTLLMLFSGIAWSGPKPPCEQSTTIQMLKDLTALDLSSRSGVPEQKNYDWLDGELKKLQSAGNQSLSTSVDQQVATHTEKIMADMLSKKETLKKKVDVGIDNNSYGLLKGFVESFNATSKQVYLPEPKEKESTQDFVIRNAVGFKTHRQFAQKTTQNIMELVSAIEERCLPKQIIRDVKMGETPYRALYCVEGDEKDRIGVEKANGPVPSYQCRMVSSCGFRTVEGSSNPQLFTAAISYTCNKKDSTCPSLVDCYKEADKKIVDYQKNYNAKEKGAQQ